MADIDYFEDDRASGAVAGGDGARIGTMVNWAGAVVSLGLVVGMGVWAWQLTMRDVSGVPVIRALEGPMRVPPADPGGAQAPNQGLAVNRIAEGAEAAPVPDQLVLAPPPVDLDGFAPNPAPVARPVAAQTPEQVNTETQSLINRLIARGEAFELEGPVIAAQPLVDGDAAEAIVPEPVAQETEAAAAVEPEAGPSIIPASVPGVSRSLRPLTRPSSLQVSSSASTGSGVAAAASATAPAVVPVSSPEAATAAVMAMIGQNEMDPTSLTEGTRLVQLGAFDTADLAREHWDRLAAQFPDFFAERSRVIQEASSGGASFYRLRAHGFDDLAGSRRFCAALVPQGASCIPVTIR